MRGRVDSAFASYTLPWANMGCICLSLEVNASHQTSLPVQHLPIRMESSYICVWGWHFNAHLFSHFFICKKNLVFYCPSDMKKNWFIPRKRRKMFLFPNKNISHLSARLILFSSGKWMYWSGKEYQNWNFRKYLKSKRLHYCPQLRKQWILMASGHAWTAWSFCVGSSCRWSVGARAYFAINVKISSPGSV